jgi:LytS/YehU family sensor histidine kinase
VLETQLQPHFLLNTLNTVAELVHTEPDLADQMITGLGRLLRLSLGNAGHRIVRLQDEIDFLRLYIDIEQLRFQNRVQVTWQVASDTLDAAVPTLLWHPILENAMLHGLAPTGMDGRIVIAARREEEDLVLEIRDNGRGLPETGVQREGVGLRSIRERVVQLYGARGRFTLETAPGGGTVAALRLPYAPYDEAQTAAPPPGKGPAGEGR